MSKLVIPIVNLATPAGTRAIAAIMKNRSGHRSSALATVKRILDDVQKSGDKALFAYTKKFDGVALSPRSLKIDKEELSRQADKTPPALQKAIRGAARRIRAYHVLQKTAGFSLKTPEGRLSQVV
ncbi:MAG: histidinol dehydrogenase, partial [Chitinivibrionales bacterium]|nr:histidinol dehydrogenase [Chitinivibrionales bacterium]